MEIVRDHIVSNIHGKETPFKMWKALTQLFENSSDHENLALKDKLQNIKMRKNETIPQYLCKFTQVHDEIGGVSVNVAEYELVSMAPLGLPKRCHN